MTAAQMVETAQKLADDWTWDAFRSASPARFTADASSRSPSNLGDGWVGFDYEAAFGKSHEGRERCGYAGAAEATRAARCFSSDSGTGLGSALVANGFVQPMELGHLSVQESDVRGLRQAAPASEARQEAVALRRCRHRRQAELRPLEPDYVVLGGGNAKKLDELPPNARLGAQRRRVHRWVPPLGPRGARPDRGLGRRSLRRLSKPAFPLTCAPAPTGARRRACSAAAPGGRSPCYRTRRTGTSRWWQLQQARTPRNPARHSTRYSGLGSFSRLHLDPLDRLRLPAPCRSNELQCQPSAS